MDFDPVKKEFILDGFERATFTIESNRVPVANTEQLLEAVQGVLSQPSETESTDGEMIIGHSKGVVVNPEYIREQIDKGRQDLLGENRQCAQAALSVIFEYGVFPEISIDDFFGNNGEPL